MITRVLLVDDDAAVREAIGQTLELADLTPTLAASYIEAKDHIAPEFAGVVITDVRMPGKDGFQLLEYAQKIDADLPVILLTGEADVPMAVRSMAAGAFDFLEKPCAPKDLLVVVARALKTRMLVLENRRLKRQLETGDPASRMLFGASPLAEDMRTRVRTVAKSSAAVLITGEPGTGISKVAEVIHLSSPFAMHPFVKRASAALSSEAMGDAFADAGPGTLFLDEVASLSADAQFALLERMEGESGVRILAGTCKELDAEAAAGRFSYDLFYKLDVMQVRIPSLRERPEDIPGLFRNYVAIACEQANLPQPDITPEIISRLMAQDWPGNARGLMNAAMRFAMNLSEPEKERDSGLVEQLAQVERSLLIEALRHHQGNATETAKALKLPRKTFYDKLSRSGIRAEDYR